ncbi:unnamed protein product [Arabis nemorensis]|uniref:Uncharacterized protein n=1 Tax=Arabis nemorensis TaxID=586526 RepID=A0A565BC16_9BRAS|nr:unnamed protein product [Arabis nemorensis]
MKGARKHDYGQTKDRLPSQEHEPRKRFHFDSSMVRKDHRSDRITREYQPKETRSRDDHSGSEIYTRTSKQWSNHLPQIEENHYSGMESLHKEALMRRGSSRESGEKANQLQNQPGRSQEGSGNSKTLSRRLALERVQRYNEEVPEGSTNTKSNSRRPVHERLETTQPSKGEGENDGPPERKINLSLAHARELHEEEKTSVDYIITDDDEAEIDENEFGWYDEIAHMVASKIIVEINKLERKVNDFVAAVGELKSAINVIDISIGQECLKKAINQYLESKVRTTTYVLQSYPKAASLVGDYQCAKRLLHRARECYLIGTGEATAELYVRNLGKLNEKLKGMTSLSLRGVTTTVKDFADIHGRTKCLQAKVVDLLIRHTRENFSKFSKIQKKERHQLQKQLMQYFSEENAANVDAGRFYFPFKLDKTY